MLSHPRDNIVAALSRNVAVEEGRSSLGGCCRTPLSTAKVIFGCRWFGMLTILNLSKDIEILNAPIWSDMLVSDFFASLQNSLFLYEKEFGNSRDNRQVSVYSLLIFVPQSS
jgi:hypothetical protein